MTSLRASIDSVYTVVSQRLLHILFKKYKLMDHLTAVRRYLLLGQGDFVRHLMGCVCRTHAPDQSPPPTFTPRRSPLPARYAVPPSQL